jgi:hypothetical protein
MRRWMREESFETLRGEISEGFEKLKYFKIINIWEKNSMYLGGSIYWRL